MNYRDKIIDICINELLVTKLDEEDLKDKENELLNMSVKTIKNNYYLYNQKNIKGRIDTKYIRKLNKEEAEEFNVSKIRKELKKNRNKQKELLKVLNDLDYKKDLYNVDQETFRSVMQHKLTELKDKEFISWVTKNKIIEKYFIDNQYFASLYTLSLFQYLCRKNRIKNKYDFKKIDEYKLNDIAYPQDVKLLDAMNKTDKYSKDAKKKSIKEFLDHNIVEVNVYDAI